MFRIDFDERPETSASSYVRPDRGTPIVPGYDPKKPNRKAYMAILNTIVVIDDDPTTGLLLERANHQVQLASRVLCFYSAVDGLDYCMMLADQQKEAPEIIFLNIRMPIVSGWQFLAQFNALGWLDTTVYMLASSTDQMDINRAKRSAGVEDYLVKPITADRLRTIRDRTVVSALREETVVRVVR